MTQQWQVKRVAIDFEWPIGQPWHGYINPWPSPVKCSICSGLGLNEAGINLYTTFRRWAPNLTKLELEVAKQSGMDEKDLIALRNRIWSSDNDLVRSYLVEIRARRRGVWGLCSLCKGKKLIPNPNPAVQQLYTVVNLFEEWQPVEPPRGKGWQLWQLNSNGGFPASPVFESDEALSKWCSIQFKTEFEKWLRWVSKDGSRIEPEKPTFKLQSENIKVFDQSKRGMA